MSTFPYDKTLDETLRDLTAKYLQIAEPLYALLMISARKRSHEEDVEAIAELLKEMEGEIERLRILCK